MEKLSKIQHRRKHCTLNGIQIGCIPHIVCFNEFVKS